MKAPAVFALLLLFLLAATLVSREPQTDPRLKNSYRRPDKSGWTFVHLEGAPADVGFQHGYLLAPEIRDGFKVTQLELTHDNNKSWGFFRHAAQEMLWPHIEQEYRDELKGITDGLNAHGVKLDIWDVVAMNATMEWGYYVHEYDKQTGLQSPPSVTAPDHCSAFVATGSYTKDGRVVMGHNNWTQYLDGERWTIMFDIAPAGGHHFIMDGYPGLIHSGDDFGINDAGMMITETTISNFHGWDSNGTPEFVRGRKALQYSASIDDFARIMKEGNNGGYANNWLVADRKTNEIADLELGLKNVNLMRTKDGYFVGSNFPVNEKLASQETDFPVNDLSNSANARRVRWEQLMKENKGKIDVTAAEHFLADHYDTYDRQTEPDERTLCGHVDLSARGDLPWQPPYGIAGAVINKVSDSAMAEKLTLAAAAGHACGIHFKAARHLKQHPEFAWQKEYLHDMNAHPWATFNAGM
ncbi:MAG TPA: C45 family peptidase [Bryobacteraceae bacterium]|nr:C45 family peptidase [Bryobacteraceae bacterium]